tara:strand:- start:468 stop:752 length:285 start_codon:yes stop_codon:yes gene_type:complete
MGSQGKCSGTFSSCKFDLRGKVFARSFKKLSMSALSYATTKTQQLKKTDTINYERYLFQSLREGRILCLLSKLCRFKLDIYNVTGFIVTSKKVL